MESCCRNRNDLAEWKIAEFIYLKKGGCKQAEEQETSQLTLSPTKAQGFGNIRY